MLPPLSTACWATNQMHLSKLRCVELLTGEERRGEKSVVYFSDILVFFPTSSDIPPPPSFSLSQCQNHCVSSTLCLSLCKHPSLDLPPLYLSLQTPVHPCSLYLNQYYHNPCISPCIAFSLQLHSSLYLFPQLSVITSLLPSLCPAFSSLHPSRFPSFATIISVLVSSHHSLSGITPLPRFIAIIIITMSYCRSPGVIISISLGFLSYPAGVLGCFYSTHSPPIFITRRTKYHNLSLSVFLSIAIRTLCQPTVKQFR